MTTVTLTRGDRSVQLPPELFARMQTRCLLALQDAAEVAVAEQRPATEVAELAIAAVREHFASSGLTAGGQVVAMTIAEAIIRTEHGQILAQALAELGN